MQAKRQKRGGLPVSTFGNQENSVEATHVGRLQELKPVILVVDDDDLICEQLRVFYECSGQYCVEMVNSGESALEHLEKGDVDLVVTDIRLPGISGVELTIEIQKNHPNVPVIAITGHAAIESAIEVLKHGAFDYIVKPFNLEAIQQSTQVALERARDFIEIRHLRRSLGSAGEFGGMLSRTAEMHRVFEIIRMVAPTDVTVLIEGETGTGKELVASAIHHQSLRRTGPFVTINCAGFPESLLESELFGHERGAFTGADRARAGKIELAHGGSLFLDEIESISPVMQAKLLRVLEDQKVQRLGAMTATQVDMRVIAATNVPLEELVAQGQMRTDFYYRLAVIPISLIPLRNRREDIPLLVDDFLRHHPVAKQKGIKAISGRMRNLLMQYDWPGNIRELQNVLEKGIVLATGPVIDSFDLPATSTRFQKTTGAAPSVPLNQWLREQEREYLIQQLRSLRGRVDLTAQSCGLGVRTLSRKLRLYGIDRGEFRRKDQNVPRETLNLEGSLRSRY